MKSVSSKYEVGVLPVQLSLWASLVAVRDLTPEEGESPEHHPQSHYKIESQWINLLETVYNNSLKLNKTR